MSRTPLRIATLLAAMLAAWQPSSALANPEDTQFWLVGFVRGEIADDVFLTVDSSYRWRDPEFGADQQTLRVSLEKGLDDAVRIGGGMSVFQTGSVTEYRPHQQFRYAAGGLDLRTRFEQRWFDGADQVELRIRQRVQYSQPVAPRVEIVGSAEWFGIVQSRRDTGQRGTEQIRSIIGVSYEVNDSLSIAPSYLFQITPRTGAPDAISHVPQLTLNYSF
ncbi:hypothetical protein C0V72_04315 [Porphyrobacter sp. TH134]|uniref:DUF2490 domain-containing protein n=1 Tax=Porphyrobacter sp. TH134 TaxID=2067450 RepID=UPI000C7A4AE1|nr:DUF2490 domain-containing protein [Porphyrobacter sp. TH134]PLK24727.1 hypothetical protein C0V72_04315 [Porphyrobacter sp. TH134]